MISCSILCTQADFPLSPVKSTLGNNKTTTNKPRAFSPNHIAAFYPFLLHAQARLTIAINRMGFIYQPIQYARTTLKATQVSY